jgi:hypothetical protein
MCFCMTPMCCMENYKAWELCLSIQGRTDWYRPRCPVLAQSRGLQVFHVSLPSGLRGRPGRSQCPSRARRHIIPGAPPAFIRLPWQEHRFTDARHGGGPSAKARGADGGKGQRKKQEAKWSLVPPNGDNRYAAVPSALTVQRARCAAICPLRAPAPRPSSPPAE